MPRARGTKLVAQNRKARHDYEFLETFEAGMALQGTEIKSVRQSGKVNLRQAYVQPRGRELWLINANIAEYEHGNRENHDPLRPRKLLLHRRQINHIIERLRMDGLTCIPVKLYLKDGLAKVEIAVARGKKQYDKRQDIAKRDAKRQIQRTLKRGDYY